MCMEWQWESYTSHLSVLFYLFQGPVQIITEFSEAILNILDCPMLMHFQVTSNIFVDFCDLINHTLPVAFDDKVICELLHFGIVVMRSQMHLIFQNLCI